jgi:uncharacterized repeat protein (TIGR04138 family)
MHRDGAAAFPPACLHYVLELVRNESRRRAAVLPPADMVAAFRRAARSDFGSLCREVLEDWELRVPADLGHAVLLLGRYGCLSLDAEDTPGAFATDTVPFTEGRP